MAVVAQDVRDLSLIGEFDSLTDSEINRTITRAASTVEDTQWNDLRDQGVTALTAHLLAIGLRSSSHPRGSVSSESAGGIARSFGASPSLASDGDYGSTTFGVEYLRLRRLLPLTPLTMNTRGVAGL